MNDDLISRQAAIDAIYENEISNWCDKDEVSTILNDLPSADAVKVVRCKDCVHYKGHWYCETWNNSPGFPAVTEDGFCNMAERRTDETD